MGGGSKSVSAMTILLIYLSATKPEAYLDIIKQINTLRSFN